MSGRKIEAGSLPSRTKSKSQSGRGQCRCALLSLPASLRGADKLYSLGSSKSRRDGLFIDRQPPYRHFLFVFQRRGSVASVASGRVLRAAEKQKETSGGRLVYKQAIPTGFQDLDTDSQASHLQRSCIRSSKMSPPKMRVRSREQSRSPKPGGNSSVPG